MKICTSSRIHKTQVITHRHQTRAVTVQNDERAPSRLQGAAFWEPLLLHILHNENRLFLNCRSWWTVSMLTPTAPFSNSVCPVCQCIVYMYQSEVSEQHVSMQNELVICDISYNLLRMADIPCEAKLWSMIWTPLSCLLFLAN